MGGRTPVRSAAMSLRDEERVDDVQGILERYGVADSPAVVPLRLKHPAIVGLLAEIDGAIRRCFGPQVRAELAVDQQAEGMAAPQLVVQVDTAHLPVGEALRLLDEFDRNWWLPKRATVDCPIVVTVT